MTFYRFLGSIPFWMILFACNVRAQTPTAIPPADTLHLLHLLDSIRASNPELQAATLEADALALRSAQVQSLPDPGVAITYLPYPIYTARGTQRSQWRVEQAVPFPGKLGLQGDIADASTDIAAYEAQTFEQDLLFEAKTAYYELYRIQQQTALVQAFQERLQDFEENAATRYVVGTGMQQAILKAQLERNALLQRLLTLGQLHRSSLEKLARLLNTSLDQAATEVLEPPALPEFQADSLLTLALKLRPEASALRSAARRSELQIELAEKNFLPDFGFNVTYFDVGSASIPASASGRDAVALGVTLKIPLQRGRLKAALEEAQLKQKQVEARVEALSAAFRTQIADLISQLVREEEQMTLFQEALIPQAETSRESTLSAYATGRTDFLDLLDAERMLFSLQTGFEDAFARYMKTVAALERTLGIPTLSELDRL